ncbi:MAG TPA: XdhC/CoxI family protein [Nitrospirota bacterium]|nr:XdhC/CoxI family protein [Nitrospirota bacterium]
MQVYEEALRLKGLGKSSAVATIVECHGSSPQKQGAKMLVRDDGSIMGTLGGGCLEADVVQGALLSLKSGEPITLPFELTEREGGLVCGGTVLVYIDPVLPDPHLVILGAGHVGKRLARLARFTGFRVTVVDDRKEFANRDNIPDASELMITDFERAFENIPVEVGMFIVVATRGHNHDLDAVKAALRTGASYIGLLGSRRKKALLNKALQESGFSRDDINRVIIPVGMEIGSVTPEEISVSIMAQIIQKRRDRGASRGSAASCSRLVQENGVLKATSASRE